MPALMLMIEAVSGVHPYGSLARLESFLATGQTPFAEKGPCECPAEAFAGLKILGPALRRTPRLARLALTAILDTPHFRTGDGDGMERDNSALVVATAYGSVTPTFDFMDSLLEDGPDMASPTAFSHSVTNMTAAMLGQHLRMTGPAMTVTDAGGRPFQAALTTAAGILESGGADRVFLCAVEERHPTLVGIAGLAGADDPSPEGAVTFVLSRGTGKERPHIAVPAFGDAFGDDFPRRVPATDVYGSGSLAVAWNAALAFLTMDGSASDPIRCMAAANSDRSSDVLLTAGERP